MLLKVANGSLQGIFNEQHFRPKKLTLYIDILSRDYIFL